MSTGPLLAVPLQLLPASVAENADLAVFLVVGVLAGAHCLGMCGPLVTTYAEGISGQREALTFREIRQHGLFNLGRTASYALIGGLLGALGGLLVDAAAVVAIARSVRGVTGIAIGVVIAYTGPSGFAFFPPAGYPLRNRIESAASPPWIQAWARSRVYGTIQSSSRIAYVEATWAASWPWIDG